MTYRSKAILVSAIFILAGLIFLSKPSFGESFIVRQASVQDTYKASSEGNIQFIDVRETNEVAEVAPRGARNIPMSRIIVSTFAATTGIQKAETLYIICRSGSRSIRVAQALAAEGYANIYNVTGGMIAWEAARLPTTKSP